MSNHVRKRCCLVSFVDNWFRYWVREGELAAVEIDDDVRWSCDVCGAEVTSHLSLVSLFSGMLGYPVEQAGEC